MLPAEGKAIRPSKMGRRRAIVLGIVQALIVLHVVVWIIGGRGPTLSPVEPSEAMHTLEHGEVNAGFVFFAVAILSTLVFGRFFCGWACHVVLLQDLCGWMMKKIGIRPRPFRSRLLVWAPLFFALYMFVWPTFKRIVVFPALSSLGWEGVAGWLKPVAEFPGWSNHLVRADFWSTFPPWYVAIPFLLVCGFAAVYFLGSKGFCTYGCPYGGFFAVADRVAPGRIRVTDACEHCGHCTAVCTSNVRVHEEVRTYGMVVDPGCMKCMDCVSVCPNDALYFGFGSPEVAKGEPREKPKARRYDLTWGQEVGIAGVFVMSFLASRGLYGQVPLLFAIGIAGCVAYLAWLGWQLLTRADVRLHRFQLKRGRRVTGAGWVWGTAIAALLLLTAQSGAVQYHRFRGVRTAEAIVMTPTEAIRLYGAGQLRLEPESEDAAAVAIAHLRRADAMAHGGWGLAESPDVAETLARLHIVRGEMEAGMGYLERAIDFNAPSEPMVVDLATLLAMSGQRDEAIATLERALAARPEMAYAAALRASLGRQER